MAGSDQRSSPTSMQSSQDRKAKHNAHEDRDNADEDWEGQEGMTRSIARQEALKHLKKQHPQRDIPRIDGEVPE